MKITQRVLFFLALTGLKQAEDDNVLEEDGLRTFDEVSDGGTGEFPKKPSGINDSDINFRSLSSDRSDRSDRSDTSSRLYRREIYMPGGGFTFIRDSSLTNSEHSCDCGRINEVIAGEIIKGGNRVYPNYRYPWMVALQKNGKTYCGGTLITQQHILTAGHCLEKKDGNILNSQFIQPGEVTVAFVSRTAQVNEGPPVQEIIPHPDFDFVTVNNDIAVLKLSQKITCSKFRRPICLPKPSMPVHHGKRFITAGWGTSGKKVAEKSLREAKIERVAFKTYCKKFLSHMKNTYCLKGLKSSSPCHGDSGGPMFAEHRRRFYIFGITSLHISAVCNTNSAFMYTKVPKYMKWIQSVIGKTNRLGRLLIQRQRQRCNSKCG